jgi:DNA adenine methylase
MVENDINITKPFLKWVGGKTQIIEDIIKEYPNEMNNYHDIFLGGGSTLFALLSYVKIGKIEVSNNIYAYDLNDCLISVYKNIQKRPKKTYRKYKKIMTKYENCKDNEINRKPTNEDEANTSQESFYYWIRGKYNDMDDIEKNKTKGSAMFLFLNKTCFRGIYRIGPNGFNVPFGHYKNIKMIDKKIFMSISELVRNVKFMCCDFEKSIGNVKVGDFAYLDPPYVPEKITSFVKYNGEGFDEHQHKKLFDMCENMRRNKIKFMMSNSNVKTVRDIFSHKKYNTKVIEVRIAIHSKNPSEKTNEIIIKSF